MSPSDNPEVSDPDFFAIANLAVSTVSMIAQLTGIKIPLPTRQRLSPPLKALEEVNDKMRKDRISDLEEVTSGLIRTTSKLVRLVAKTNPNAMGARFEFGTTYLEFPRTEFSEMASLTGEISHGLTMISMGILSLIQITPEAAAEIASKISATLGNLAPRIRDIYAGKLTYEETLDECLIILRAFQKILDNLQELKN